MKEYARRKQNTVSNTASAGMSFSRSEAGNIPNSSMEAVMAGRAKASSEMMGHRQDLAPSLNAKMAKAFGMDLSNMQIYRSEAMSGTETEGLASGNKIVLSSDIDLNTTAGQAVLGHEISHVRAQNQGIGMGNTGLYQNAGLEHQADVEGMMAARGQSILGDSTGMDMGLGMGGLGGLTPMGAGMSSSAGAPMQAKKGGKKAKSAAPAPVAAEPVREMQPIKRSASQLQRLAGFKNKARIVSENMQNLTEKDDGNYLKNGFDEDNYKSVLRQDTAGQLKPSKKMEALFKNMVKAHIQNQFITDKYWKNGQTDEHDAAEKWYTYTLMPSMEDEYWALEGSGMPQEPSKMPLDYEEYLKSLKK